MHVYIDFDDVISETARYFVTLVKEMYGKDICYQDIRFFNLQKSFSLTDEEYTAMMKKAHASESLLSYGETPGASQTVRKWINEGHDVKIVTGRPASSFKATRQWLENHGLKNIQLVFVDKYGRDEWDEYHKNNTEEKALSTEEFSLLNFDFAVEDSPHAFEPLQRQKNCITAVFNRPWNQIELPEKFIRCQDWNEIDRVFHSLQK